MSLSRIWQPLLAGEAAEQAWQAVLAVAADLEGAAATEVSPLLGSGLAGQALFFAYLAVARSDEACADLGFTCLDRALDALAGPPMPPGLFQGFSGIAWTMQHLSGRLLPAEEGSGLLRQIDEVLIDLLAAGSFVDHDLINGLAGIGVYALDGLPRPSARTCLERVVERIGRLAEERAEGITWLTRPELLIPEQRAEAPCGYFNLGVSHGVPAVVAVLAEAAAVGVECPGSLTERAVHWLLAQEQEPAVGSLFANWVGEGFAPHPSRLAWCYGDPGIAAALLFAARQAGREDWEKEARRIAGHAAARPVEGSQVRDAGLCHGAAGLGHLFNRLAQATGDVTFTEAARFWLGQALRFRRTGEGVGGFISWSPFRRGWQADAGFLTGAAGIGLALLAAVSPVEPAWDRVLRIAGPPRGAAMEQEG